MFDSIRLRMRTYETNQDACSVDISCTLKMTHSLTLDIGVSATFGNHPTKPIILIPRKSSVRTLVVLGGSELLRGAATWVLEIQRFRHYVDPCGSAGRHGRHGAENGGYTKKKPWDSHGDYACFSRHFASLRCFFDQWSGAELANKQTICSIPKP